MLKAAKAAYLTAPAYFTPESYPEAVEGMRIALTTAIEDVEGLARALHADDLERGYAGELWEDMQPDVQQWYRYQAEAAGRWLTGKDAE